MRLAMPAKHAVQVQAHAAVRLAVAAGDPGIGGVQLHAQFFIQFAGQCLEGALAGFELAAGEIPVAGPRLAGRPLRQQYTAAPMGDDAESDIDDGVAVRLSRLH
jgi:hypothetical protein